jgi:hypothetical protein
VQKIACRLFESAKPMQSFAWGCMQKRAAAETSLKRRMMMGKVSSELCGADKTFAHTAH